MMLMMDMMMHMTVSLILVVTSVSHLNYCTTDELA